MNDTALDNLAKQYADNYDDEADEFYCVPCKKAFKSEKQWGSLCSLPCKYDISDFPFFSAP